MNHRITHVWLLTAEGKLEKHYVHGTAVEVDEFLEQTDVKAWSAREIEVKTIASIAKVRKDAEV